MQLRYKLELICHLDQFRYCLDSVKILFRLGVGGGGWEDYSKNKTNLSLRLVEVEAELGNNLLSPASTCALVLNSPR